GGNIVPVTSFSYQDVGIRIELETRIHHNQEVTLDIHVEVSQISGNVEGSQGAVQPIIGTRNIESTIRLRDGETNFMAGLIRTDDVNSSAGVPGLADIPVVGRLFSKKTTQQQRTDVVLTITPHIVRSPDISERDLEPIWVGTEANITFRGGSPQVESPVEGPFEREEDAEQLQEMIRQRLENLPRGLRGQGEGSAEEGEGEAERGLVPRPRRNVLDQPAESSEPPEEEDEPPGIAPVSWRGAELRLVPARLPGTGRPVAEVVSSESSSPKAPVRLGFSAEPALTVPLEQLFEVALEVDARQPVAHLPIILSFDPEVLEVAEVYEGDFFAGSGTVLADHSTPGRLVVGASQLGTAPAVSGKGTVVTILFRAVGAGTTRLAFRQGRALGSDLEPVGPVARGRLEITADPEAPPLAPPERPPRPRVA
ncbi:MAG: cohesin domain-containing protein, partial [Thermoanaerobaculia bacterium]|nr:cohesin domain-containing protein [Thermoanaerobaculia bacterium]